MSAVTVFEFFFITFVYNLETSYLAKNPSMFNDYIKQIFIKIMRLFILFIQKK